MQYKGWISNGLVGCEREFDFEIDDEELKNMSEDDIEEIASEWMHSEIEWGFEPVEKEVED